MSLDLSYNLIQDKGVKALAESSTFSKLKSLNLKSNQISYVGANYLSQNASWTQLRTLILSWNNISSKGAVLIISNTKTWSNLLDLYLFNVGIDLQQKEKFLEEIETKYLHISAKKYGEKYLMAEMPDTILEMDCVKSSCIEEDNNDSLIITGYFPESVVRVFDLKRKPLRIALN